MKKIILYTALILTLSACGTLFSGSTQDISFDSNQKDVKIYVDGMEICKTPCIFPLERKSSTVIIRAQKKGFEDKQLILRSNLNKLAILNLSFWPSWLTDVASGGMWQYHRDGVYIDMEKAPANKTAQAQIKKNVAIRRFSLFGYNELKLEAASNTAGEYITGLSSLSKIPPQTLIKTIRKTQGAVNLAHTLTNIEQ